MLCGCGITEGCDFFRKYTATQIHKDSVRRFFLRTPSYFFNLLICSVKSCFLCADMQIDINNDHVSICASR